jgi:hypothetical protein
MHDPHGRVTLLPLGLGYEAGNCSVWSHPHNQGNGILK